MAQAAKADDHARECTHEKDRAVHAETARGWRDLAILARRQEAWEAANPA